MSGYPTNRDLSKCVAFEAKSKQRQSQNSLNKTRTPNAGQCDLCLTQEGRGHMVLANVTVELWNSGLTRIFRLRLGLRILSMRSRDE